MIYKFKHWSTYRGLDPQTAGETLEEIRRKNNGHLRPEDVVKDASEKFSPLHSAFTWEDSRAAKEFRLLEARQLIKAVVVMEKTSSEPIPAFWNVSVTATSSEGVKRKERYYQSAQVIAKDPNAYASALQVMRQELETAQRGLDQLRHLAPRRDRTKIDRTRGHLKSAMDDLPPTAA